MGYVSNLYRVLPDSLIFKYNKQSGPRGVASELKFLLSNPHLIRWGFVIEYQPPGVRDW